VTRPPLEAGKDVWRAWARAVRAALPDASEAVCAQVEPFLQAARPRVVLAYRSFGAEVSLDSLPARHPDVVWLAPRVNRGGELSLHHWDEPSEAGPFGIRQAAASAAPVDPTLVDVVLVPGLVFDEAGYRLGYGRGYYDRLLPRLRANAPLVGIARDLLIVPEHPRDEWDWPLTHLASESRLLAIDAPEAR
jgi:5-formyltetrahydrofolate cyclo-ligase